MYFQQSCGFNLYGITHMISNIITSYDNSSYIYIFKTYTIYIYICFNCKVLFFLALFCWGQAFCIQPILHGFGRTGAEIQVIICNSQQLLAGVGPWDMACRPAKKDTQKLRGWEFHHFV